MQFKTSDNLIDLLVGENLYSNPDVAMRELLQNSEDACQLQSCFESSYEPRIVVGFSESENLVEVTDNGLGMDREIFEESFATIGASKTESPKLQALLLKAGSSAQPIGQFGIGVLSCFGVADTVEVFSHDGESAPVSVRIRDRREPFEELEDHRDTRGTTLRLKLKPGGPMRAAQVRESVSRYVRHARHIWIEDIDTGECQIAPEQWLQPNWEQNSEIVSNIIESGHLQLSAAWDNINLGLDGQLVLCNGGFLVDNAAVGVLPGFAVGLRGEINIRPGALKILMSREGFQHDEDWLVFAEELKLT